MTPASSPTGDTAVLVALCENYEIADPEADPIPCGGRLRFRWGLNHAACDLCGACCGIAVAKWERVEPAVSSSSPDDTAPAGDRLPPALNPDGVEVDHDCEFRRMLRDIGRWFNVETDAEGRFRASEIKDKVRAAASAAVPGTASEVALIAAELRTLINRYESLAPAYGGSWSGWYTEMRDTVHCLRATVEKIAGAVPVPADGDTEETR